MQAARTSVTAQEIGALAMMDKLTRLWLPAGTPRANIEAGVDGEWYKRLYEKLIADRVAQDSWSSRENTKEREAYYRRTYRFRNDSYFRFYADRGDNTRFEYDERFNFWRFFSTDPFPSNDEEPGYKFFGYMGCISFDDEYGLFIAGSKSTTGVSAGGSNRPETPYSNQKRTQFADKWLPFFRRNCWLCGCDIECSTRERIEWTQQFPRDASPILELEFEVGLFTRRERQDLQQALPREFWPKTWLDEEGE